MTPLILGVDSGSTATKAVLFAPDGGVIDSEAAVTPPARHAGGRVERDPDAHWAAVAAVIRALVRRHPGADIAGVGVAGQGDGLLLVDAAGRPVGPAILSTDARAEDVIAGWRASGVVDALLPVTGQTPFPGSTPPLLAWADADESGLLDRARWAIASKDWIRFRLTGRIATDRTDASAGFAAAATQAYSARAIELYGLGHRAGLLPEILEPTELAGRVTPHASAETGLREGTPVVAGMHDVIAAVVGSAGLQPGRLCVIAGTFGVNVVLTTAPTVSPDINSRSGPTAGLWAPRRTSRASASNIDWALRLLSGPVDSTGSRIDRALAGEVVADAPLYVPFLHGGNEGQPASASLLGIRAWHDPDDVLRAVLQGVTFNHRADVERVESLVPVTDIGVMGGASRSSGWVQLFADTLGRTVSVAPGDDSGARGAAMCVAAALGVHSDLASAASAMAASRIQVDPGEDRAALDSLYDEWTSAVAQLSELGRRRGATVSAG